MKKGCFIELILLFIVGVSFVHAVPDSEIEKKSFTICQSGCDYTNPGDLVADNTSIDSRYYNITINVTDDGEYDFSVLNGSGNIYAIIGNKDARATIAFEYESSTVYAFKNLFLEIPSIITSELLEMDNVETLLNSEVYSPSDVKIINSKFNKNFGVRSLSSIIFDNNDVKEYSFFIGDVYIDNSIFSDNVDITGKAEVKNSNVISKSNYGIVFRTNIFTNLCDTYIPAESNDSNNEKFRVLVDNVTVHGAKIFGIYYEVPDKMYDSFEIRNSDLTGNHCSFGVEVKPTNECTSVQNNGNFDSVYSVKKLGLSANDYNVLIDNTKLSCACSLGLEESGIFPIVYIPSSNTWVDTVVRTDSFDSIIDKTANVFEGSKAKVLIEMTNTGEVVLDDKVYKDVNSYFSELQGVNPGYINWQVVDNKILKIENGQIIPLMIGETDVIASYNNNDYTTRIKVTSLGIIDNVSKQIVNPNTKDQIFLIFMLGITSFMYYLFTRFAKRKVKY